MFSVLSVLAMTAELDRAERRPPKKKRYRFEGYMVACFGTQATRVRAAVELLANGDRATLSNTGGVLRSANAAFSGSEQRV